MTSRFWIFHARVCSIYLFWWGNFDIIKFFLVNKLFSFFPIFQASHSNKGSICLIEGCTQQTSLSLPMLALGWSYLLRSSSTWWIVSYRFHIFLCSYLPISSSNRQIVSYRIYIFWCWTIFHGLHIDFWMFCH